NDSSCAPAHNTPFPLRRSPPASFKRLLDGGIFGLNVAEMRFELRQTRQVSKGIKEVLEEDDPYPGAILGLQKPRQELLCGSRESCVGAGDEQDHVATILGARIRNVAQ